MIGLSFLTNYELVLSHFDQSCLRSFARSFAREEYESAKWMVETLASQKKSFDNIAILGSSYGTYLIPMLCTILNPSNIVLYDKDAERIRVAEMLHNNIRSDTSIQSVLGDIDKMCDQISASSYNLVIIPYGETVNSLAEIRLRSNKVFYAVQAQIGNEIGNAMDLVLSSGCIQHSYRGVQTVGRYDKAMIIGTKAVR